MNRELLLLVDALAREKNVPKDIVFTALESVTDADLARTIYIRKQPHSVMQAINRNLTHTASHVGQIILLAKHFQSDRWKTLTMPRRKPAVLQDRAPASTTKE